ncbi:hypothetical protein [Kitasatospora sp. NPDC090091]|uniref:hypothetical protein n=1 Tax=Kitasatospora sp. NPDC090091 TaxID=3364081 RepID=UPI0037FFB105
MKDKPFSQAVAEALVRASGRPGSAEFSGTRISDWAPEDVADFKVPQSKSDDKIVALVHLWSQWAGEAVDRKDEKWWREQLGAARAEQKDERDGRTSASGIPHSEPEPESVTTVRGVRLEVHLAVTPPGDQDGPEPPTLTPYVSRAHDAVLRAALEPALAGGPSLLVMLTGDSSTGKTRALYEALLALAADRPVLRPATADDLLELLRSDRITSGTVLWLNESQNFLYGESGERAAAGLRRLLERRPGVAAVGTLWLDPYWSELTRPGLWQHSQALVLLTGSVTRRIPVPDTLSGREQAAWEGLARLCGDQRLRAALTVGAVDGRVVQHLSGGPELLAAYREGPGGRFTAVEHALVTAALDARHLGYTGGLPEALLAEAADGALTPRQRPADPAWASQALDALTTGRRADGTRTDIRRTLTALTAVRLRSGTPALYEPADYLDQHIRRRPARRIIAPSLWRALTDHAEAPDTLVRLAGSAKERCQYRQAVLLFRKAVRLGHAWAPSMLYELLAAAGLDPQHDGARWVAEHADLTDAHAVGWLLHLLCEAGAHDAVDVLLERGPESRIDLTITPGVGYLITLLRSLGAEDAMHILCDRIAADSPLTAPAGWLRVLGEAGAKQAVLVLLGRRPEVHADLTRPADVVELIRVLRKEGEHEAVRVLLEGRPERQADLTHPRAVAWLLTALQEERADEAVQALSRRAANHTPLVDPAALGELLLALKSAGADEAVRALGLRAAAEVRLDDRLGDVGELIGALLHVGADEEASVLSRRAAIEVDTSWPDDVATVLRELHGAGQEAAVAALLDRHPEVQARLSGPQEVAALLNTLDETGQGAALTALLTRRPEAHAHLDDAYEVAVLAYMLESLGTHEAVAALIHRAVTETDAEFVTQMLRALAEFGADQAEAVLCEQAAAGVDTSDPVGVALLLELLREVGAAGAVAVLSRRAEDHGAAAVESRRFGRDLDGDRAQPWSWRDLPPYCAGRQSESAG